MAQKMGEFFTVGGSTGVLAGTTTPASGGLTSAALILQSDIIYGSQTAYIRIPQGYLARIWSREATMTLAAASGAYVSIQYVPNYASAGLSVSTLEILAPYGNSIGTSLIDPRKPIVARGIDGNGAIQFVQGGTLASGLQITAEIEIVDSSVTDQILHSD